MSEIVKAKSKSKALKLDNYIIMDVLLLVLFLELVFPPITQFANSSVIMLGCTFLWVAFSFLTDRKFYLNSNIHRFYLFFLYALMIILPYLLGYPVIGNRYSSMAIVIFGNVIYEFYKEHGKIENLKRILFVVALFALITLGITYINLLINPYISRSIKSEGEYSASLAARGIGGYQFIYFVSAAAIPVLFVVLKAKKKVYRIISLALYILSVLLIVKSNYLTALLLTIGCSVILLIAHLWSGKKAIHKFLLCVFGIVCIVCLINIDAILRSIASFLPERISRVLITDDAGAIESIVDEFFADRFPTIKESIDAFFAHPLLGLIGSGGIGFSENYLTGFGQHSYVFDTFALYGFVIGIINIFAILKPFKRNGRWVKTNLALTIAMSIFTMLIYIVNNATASIALAICIIYPFIRDEFLEAA